MKRAGGICLFAKLIAILLGFAAGPVHALLSSSDQILNSTTVSAPLAAQDQFGADVTTGDVNGDGILDLIVGARSADVGGLNRGVVYIFFRDANGAITGETRISDPAGDPDDVLSLGSAEFGRAVEWLGDYDGDGFGELAVGEPLRSSPGKPARSGRIWILGLDTAGVPRDGFSVESASANFAALSAEDRFGISIGNAGDWDGDGAPEIAVGALWDGDGGSQNGAVYLLYLDPSSSATSIKEFVKLSDTAGGFDGAFDPPTWFGIDITSIGDLNFDGQDDLAIGASRRGPSGAVWIVLMDPDCALGAASCSALPGSVEIAEGLGGFKGDLGANDQFGSGVAFLPVPTIAPGRLAVGARGSNASFTNAGALWLLTLGSDGTVLSEGRISNGENTTFSASSPVSNIGGEFGFSVAAADDLDGDGIVDVIVGAPLKDDGPQNSGAAYVMTLNANTGPDPMERACFVSNEVGDGLIANFVDVPAFTTGNYFDQVETALETLPVTSGSVGAIDFDLENNVAGTFGPFSHNGLFGVRFTGFINLKESGTYTFSANADDGWRLRIGDHDVVVFDGLEFFRNQTQRIDVEAAGVYPFQLDFFDAAPCCNGIRFGAQGPAGSDLQPVIPGFDFDADLGPATVGGGPGTTIVPQSILFQDLPADCGPVVDSDFDGRPDDYDNCPTRFNPSQEDPDGDGFGFWCDICPGVPNPGQEDENADGEGDACETAFLSLVGSGTPSPDFELRLACGIAADEVNVSIRLPFGTVPATAEFGGNCDAPSSPPPGISPGIGCTPNPPNASLGPTVDAANSGVYGPGLASPFEDDRLYLQLVGNGPDGRICETDETVTLGRFTSGPAATFTGRPSLGGVPGEDFVLSLDGFPLVLQSYTSGPGDPDLELFLRPADGEEASTATRWALCVSEETDQRMHRISIGVQVPGAATGDLVLEGCDTTPNGLGVRDCTGTVGPSVDEGVSFTLGPNAGSAAPRVDDTLYVVVEGRIPAPGATTLNPTAFQESCIGNIAVASPPGVAGEPPLLVVDGLETLPFSDGTPAPWQTSTTLLTPLPLEDVAVGNGFETGDDTDLDGILDDADNCPFSTNFDLANRGDVLSTTPNSDVDGDACECGDTSASGAVFDDPGVESPSDLTTLRQFIVGANTDPNVAAICSVVDGVECNTRDAVVLQRALNAQDPGISPVCAAAQPN